MVSDSYVGNLKSATTRASLVLVGVLLTIFAFASCSAGPEPGPGTTAGSSGIPAGGNVSVGGGQSACIAPALSCGSGCTNVQTDASNCGTCGTVCATGQECRNGACACLAGLRTCGGVCVNTFSDPQHCGNCSQPCGGGLLCNVGTCAATCNTGLTACSGACVNDQTDPTNCGGCGMACSAGQTCSAGVCICPNAGQRPCGGQCVDVLANTANCGSCGVACATGQACVNGVCGGGQGTAGTGSGGTSGAGGSTAPAGGSSGANPGGGTGQGGTAGGVSQGGTAGSGSGTAPPGYWTSGTWHGCAWTGIDALFGSTTTNMPRDFLNHPAGMPYCVSGSVHPNYVAVALLGFNLAEPAASANCAYKPVDLNAVGPPAVQLTGGTGLAVSFNKMTASTLRVQIQGPNGASDENDRWCYTITDVSGPIFAPFAQFNTKCWDGTGTAYNGQPISAVVFTVPGAPAATPFSYCVNGFAVGTSAADAPMGGGPTGPLTGTIGGPGATDLDFQRVKVQKNGESYIIQNNNWGNPSGSDQTITFSDNSFTIVSSTGSVTGQGVPASFPSIFIGGNGDTQGGVYSTRSTDNLPRQISQIQRLMTTFRYSGHQEEKGYNAAYDVWFSASQPSAPYNDAISGFVMLWLYKPPNYHPIGWNDGTPAGSFSGAGRNWNVYVDRRGGSGPNANAPVVNYVINPVSPPVASMVNFDLKPFMVDAAKYGIPSNWYLTDVFGGFEIWNGSDAAGLKMDEFTAVVE